ncbi:MAG: DUF1579 domain-containing protein [Phycisphaeraceae bacterium]|nr:DUF1579 domain-containing protein [Phycisphaeraceae bacterium]
MSAKYLLAFVGAVAVCGSLSLGQATHTDKPGSLKPTAQPEQALPGGMSEADMQACIEAATPGKMHEYLTQAVGTWTGKVKMWMAPGTEPVESVCTTTITSLMDGRFIKTETEGELVGMGPFVGFGINGFDNVSQQFQGTWIDNFGTGMMTGTGGLDKDGKTLNWKFSYNCPITKKPIVMREVERRTSKDTMILEMFGQDLATGKEYKMMEIAYTRVTTKPAAVSGSAR